MGRQAKYLRAYGMKQNEIEPGRAVPNLCDKHVFETWADRKKRRAAEAARRPSPSPEKA